MNATPRPPDDPGHGQHVAAAALEEALAQYRPECRFVVRARVERGAPPRIRAELAIPAPYYIDDTGHFNSVEFNLCAEQLLAVLCTATGLGPSASLRVDSIGSTFHRAMEASQFWGQLELGGKRLSTAHVEFGDAAGRASSGTLKWACP